MKETFERWRRRWEASLNEARELCRSQAPLQSELIAWPPEVDEDSRPETVAGLVRTAAIGCRELRLLAAQLDNAGRDADDDADRRVPDPADSDQLSSPGTRYFRAGQRFEDAIEIRQLIQRAQHSLLIVDGYISEDTFVLASSAADNVSRRFLMLDHALTNSVRGAWARWAPTWAEGGSECRAVGRPPLPHPRYLFVDGARYEFDASLKDFGSSFTYRRLLDSDEAGSIVVPVVEAAWAAAVPRELADGQMVPH